MIFAVVTCRWGLVGGAVVWALFPDDGRRRLARRRPSLGISSGDCSRRVWWPCCFAQMVINTGMTIGLLPITGMTLPFVSAGGSSLVTAWMMIGLVLNVGLRRPRRMEQWEVAGTG